MTCLLCGDICHCSSAEFSTASPRWLADDDEFVSTVKPQATLETPQRKEPSKEPIAEASAPCDDVDPVAEDSQWRREVAARLNRYQERRKPRPPRYPSLRLQFEGEDPNNASAFSIEAAVFSPSMSSNRALALDGFADSAVHPVEASTSAPPEVIHAALPQPLRSSPAPVTTAKIIEFPRSWTPPPASPDELAEPVTNRPRILEAPEVLPPPPALGGIAIDPAPQPELEKRPGIDIPLQSASLARRILSAAIDDAIIAMACALFGFVFWKVTAIRPPGIQILEIAVGLSSLLWAAYQYLLLVYAGTTPGLRVAGLQLARFDGKPAGRRLRRWRVLASFLSAVSLGMGYAWVFLDEDALCWHDRITHTYIAPKRYQTTEAPPHR